MLRGYFAGKGTGALKKKDNIMKKVDFLKQYLNNAAHRIRSKLCCMYKYLPYTNGHIDISTC